MAQANRVNIEYIVRALAIVDSFKQTTLYPAPAHAIHAVSYFADALAGLWNRTPLEKTVLKTRGVPRSNRLDESIHRLVGLGIFVPSDVGYNMSVTGAQMHSLYEINSDLSSPVLTLMHDDEYWHASVGYIREITVATTSLGRDNLSSLLQVDASYSDPMLDFNNVVDLGTSNGEVSQTQIIGNSIAEIARKKTGHDISGSELATIYVRHLYSILASARP